MRTEKEALLQKALDGLGDALVEAIETWQFEPSVAFVPPAAFTMPSAKRPLDFATSMTSPWVALSWPMPGCASKWS